uniref:L1 transposable element RRM domain-containing protein n=1 Tax=Poecilia formosa TaxID=48698 RepID=A0A087X7F1_POEFO
MPKSKSRSTLLSRKSMLREEETNEEGMASLSDSEASLAANDSANETANLQTILQELRESCRESGDGFREVKGEIKNVNRRLDEAETRILEAENQQLEEVVMKLSKVQDEFEKLVELEGRSRRDNLRLHGIVEGSEDGSPSISAFIDNLLRDKLDIPKSLDLNIERAHHSLGPRAPPHSIIVKFGTSKVKDEILKRAWQKKGFMVAGRKVIVDHDYAPDVLKRRREYIEVKRVLKEKKIKFQTPFP